jgi:hypothetical protein
MQRLERLEIHAANACNLTCESCSHFSNSGHRGVLTVEDAANWFAVWQHRLAVSRLQIVGGEPTLNPHLAQIVELARAMWPKARIGITTNGFFLHRHPDLGSVMARCGADLNFSIHSEDADYLGAIRPAMGMVEKWREMYGLVAGFAHSQSRWTRRHKGFGPNVTPYEDGDPATSWHRCDARFCRQIFRGRLWKCSPIAYLQLQKEAHPDISEAWNPYLSYNGISADCSEEELIAFLARRAELICGMCPAGKECFSKPSPLISRARLVRQATELRARMALS